MAHFLSVQQFFSIHCQLLCCLKLPPQFKSMHLIRIDNILEVYQMYSFCAQCQVSHSPSVPVSSGRKEASPQVTAEPSEVAFGSGWQQTQMHTLCQVTRSRSDQAQLLVVRLYFSSFSFLPYSVICAGFFLFVFYIYLCYNLEKLYSVCANRLKDLQEKSNCFHHFFWGGVCGNT